MSRPPYRALQIALRVFSLLLAVGGLFMVFASRPLIMRVFLRPPESEISTLLHAKRNRLLFAFRIPMVKRHPSNLVSRSRTPNISIESHGRGDYTPVLAKHSKRFSLEDALSVGVDRMQRNFEPMRQQVESWRAQQLSSEAAKTTYRAFIEGDLEVPRHLARRVHDLYFNPQHEEFEPRTMWSLSNAFTSALKELEPGFADPT